MLTKKSTAFSRIAKELLGDDPTKEDVEFVTGLKRKNRLINKWRRKFPRARSFEDLGRGFNEFYSY